MTTTETTNNDQLTAALAHYYPFVPAEEAYKMFLDACAASLVDAHAQGVSLTLPLQLK